MKKFLLKFPLNMNEMENAAAISKRARRKKFSLLMNDRAPLKSIMQADDTVKNKRF